MVHESAHGDIFSNYKTLSAGSCKWLNKLFFAMHQIAVDIINMPAVSALALYFEKTEGNACKFI
jgi:hypothetical protein